jgi:hypothetical protein
MDMKDVSWLQTRYLDFLAQRQDSLQEDMVHFYEQECVDEANFEKIKFNVVEIFAKMFKLSLDDDPDALKVKYLGFFEKITQPWHLNRKKAIEFEKEVERIIEDVKIKEADLLKTCFEEYFNQMDADQRCAN